jgi:hypothetical protein
MSSQKLQPPQKIWLLHTTYDAPDLNRKSQRSSTFPTKVCSDAWCLAQHCNIGGPYWYPPSHGGKVPDFSFVEHMGFIALILVRPC